MSLTTFEINYGYNGEPSTASASFVYKKKDGQLTETTPDAGGLGNQISTGVPQIDSMVGDFIIAQKSEKKDGGFKRIGYELVDREAKKLESIAVLVRGITAPSKVVALDDFRLIAENSEITGEGGFGRNEVVLNGRIAVIGRSFSVVSATLGNSSASLFFSRGVIVGRTPLGAVSQAMQSELEANYKNATLRYGYYLSDLRELIEKAGYQIDGYPTDSNFIILDFGGNLREVISSLASMFGLYWIVRGNKITFFASQELSAMQIPNMVESTDSNILSATYSKDLSGRSSVGVIHGSSEASAQNVQSFDSARSVAFYYAGLEGVFGNMKKLLSGLITFFIFSGNVAIFDKIITLLMISQSDVVAGDEFDDLYGTDELTSTQPKTLEQVEENQGRRDSLKRDNKHLITNTDLYPLSNSSGGVIEKPSGTPLFGVLQAAAEAFGSIYVSQPVSQNFKETYVLAPADGISTGGPYLGTSPLSSISELQGLSLVIESFFDSPNAKNITIRQLYDAIVGSGNVLNAEESYHYIGTKDILADLSRGGSDASKYKDAVLEATKDASDAYYAHGPNGITYMPTSNSQINKIRTMVNSSKDFVKYEVGRIRNVIKVAGTKVKSDEEENEDDTPNRNFVSFRVRDSSRDLSSVSVIKFEASNSEAAYIDSNFSRLFSPDFQPESSSATYSGLIIPDNENPIVSSISFSFSDQGIETSVTYSNKEFVAESESVVMAGYSTSSVNRFSRSLKTRQKNALGVH